MKDQFRFGVLGHDISYTKSPELFQAIFDIKGVGGTCDVFDIPPEEFTDRFPRLVKSGIDGMSVTIPYKNKVVDFLSRVDPVAASLGAVNSIKVDSGSAFGYNTDCYGFAMPLREHREKLSGGSALILGCGGVAGAVVYSLCHDFGIRRLTIVGRTPERLEAFATGVRQRHKSVHIETSRFPNAADDRSGEWDIIVNGTPLGGWNHPETSPLPDHFTWPRGAIYYDANYNENNRTIEQAQKMGLTAIDGSAMLIRQATRSFFLWTGEEVAFDPVYRRVFGQRGG
jgi:shikimate dehydrogenase